MKHTAKQVFWGILLLLTAAALIFYGSGYGAEVLGIPLYKLIFTIVLAAWILAKMLFSDSLRERFKIFFPLALVFMVLETEISHWAGLADENIVNNWLVLLAAILADTAINFIIPKRTEKGHSNRFSSTTHYIDANETKKSCVYNRMGDSTVYYQNTELADKSVPLELNISNKMGNITVHIPADWNVVDKIHTNMGNIEIRQGTGGGITLILTGENKMGNIEIKSP